MNPPVDQWVIFADKLVHVFQINYHRLEILGRRGFPGQGLPGAGVGDPQAPGVEELAAHQDFNTLSPWAKGRLLPSSFPIH
jgi:hypothetical protein